MAQNKKGSISADDVKENFIVPFCSFLNFIIFYGEIHIRSIKKVFILGFFFLSKEIPVY